MRTPLLLITMAFTCLVHCSSSTQQRPSSTRSASTGWEGMHPVQQVTQGWLQQQGIPLDVSVLSKVQTRVVKLVLADGLRTMGPPDAEQLVQRYCVLPHVRTWNENLCAELEKRQCTDVGCTWFHFGNCSGMLLGQGQLLTAAHCLAPLVRDPALLAPSQALVMGADGRPRERLALGPVVLGKTDFAHDWVAVDETNPVDLARVTVDDHGLEPWPTAPLPGDGDVVFMVGFPRLERRSQEARKRHGYELVFGTPSVSFGRVADRNDQGWPLCAPDGIQEHWGLLGSCPTPQGITGAEGTVWRGPMMWNVFLASYDLTNGFSGAPVFDARGALVGINNTVIGPVNPQETFHKDTRAVATSIRAALDRVTR